MNKIKQLEVKKLLKELDFVESDFNYKSEINHEADNTFIRSVNEFLENHPTLKEVFNKKINKKIETSFNKKMDKIKSEEEELINNEELYEDEPISEEIVVVDPKMIKLKKLYREIVKATHPDRIQNKKLNEIYLRATYFYNKRDIAGAYSICDELDIFYESDEEDHKMIIDKINKLKEMINFIESTMSWKWYHLEEGIESRSEKDRIIVNYIKNQLQ